MLKNVVRKARPRCTMLVLLMVGLLAGMLSSQLPPRYAEAWSTDPKLNTPICTASGDQGAIAFASDGSGVLDQSMNVDRPQRWDIDSPKLYTAKVVLHVGDRVVETAASTKLR